MSASRLSQHGVAFIAEFEGFRSRAYRDVGGVLTIGYGHTGGVRVGQTVTHVQALGLLHADTADAEKAVRQLVHVAINQHRFDALVSFVFNVGAGAFSKSNLLRKLNQGDYLSVPRELMRWNRVDGKPVAGLTRRRAAEAALWNKPA